MHQDWEPVVLRKKPAPTQFTQSPGPTKEQKLDRAEEPSSHKKVTGSMAQAIMKGRMAKNLTQSQLAIQINQKPNVIQDYEKGKAIPNPKILQDLRRVLGVVIK
jgi:putative transcription factor